MKASIINQQEKWIERLVYLLVGALPALMAVQQSYASSALAILSIISFFSFAASWTSSRREERILAWLLVAFVLVVLMGYVNTSDVGKYWSRFERVFRLLLVIPLLFYFKNHAKNAFDAFGYGLIVAGPVLLWSAVVDSESGRSEGAYNAILFGDFTAYVTAALLVLAFVKRESWAWVLLALLASAMAGYACLLSGTRGAWGAIVVVAMLLIVTFLKSAREGGRGRAYALVAVVALLFVALAKNSIFSERVVSAGREIVSYGEGSNANTSIGYRFQMWEAAIVIWADKPYIGTGLGDYSSDLLRLIELGRSGMKEHFGEAHSLYFEFFATTGVIGVVLLVSAILFFPLNVLLKSDRNSMEGAVLQGYCLLICFGVFGLSQNWLGRSSITAVYIILLALFLANAIRRPS